MKDCFVKEITEGSLISFEWDILYLMPSHLVSVHWIVKWISMQNVASVKWQDTKPEMRGCIFSAGGQFELMPIVDATRLSSIGIFHYYKNPNYCRAEMHFAGENYALRLGHWAHSVPWVLVLVAARHNYIFTDLSRIIKRNISLLFLRLPLPNIMAHFRTHASPQYQVHWTPCYPMSKRILLWT